MSKLSTKPIALPKTNNTQQIEKITKNKTNKNN